MDILKEAEALQPWLTDCRRKLHQNAEVGFDLPETLELVRGELTALGLEPAPCGKAGLVALIEGAGPGPVILLRADMDGLPVGEETELSFASAKGRMHGCGHDLHTAMLLGAARLLCAHRDELRGTVKLMFQPAEELLEGALDMLNAGVLENPAPEAALMIHVMPAAALPLPVGTVVVPEAGVSAPAADYFTVRVQGKGCHGSMPQTGRDPLTVAARILLGLQELNARELPAGERAVLTVGTLRAGEGANVIPDTAEFRGTMRAFDDGIREQLQTRLTEIAKGIAGAYRAKAEVTFDSGCPTLICDRDLADCAGKYLKELLGSRALTAAELGGGGGGSGSEDFAYVSHRLPTLMLALAAGGESAYPLHHPQVTFDESVLPVGSAIHAWMAMRWLEEHNHD